MFAVLLVITILLIMICCGFGRRANWIPVRSVILFHSILGYNQQTHENGVWPWGLQTQKRLSNLLSRFSDFRPNYSSPLWSQVYYIFKYRHYFHFECIKNWLENNGICPICRTSMSEDVLKKSRRYSQVVQFLQNEQKEENIWSLE